MPTQKEIEKIRRLIDEYDEKQEQKNRKKFLKETKEKIHIADGLNLLCEGSIYRYEEYPWEYTPYVELDSNEIQFATCKRCLKIYKSKS